MSKKMSLMLAILFAFVGIILTAVWGKVPEDLNARIYIQELYFDITPNDKGIKTIDFRYQPNNANVDLTEYIVLKPLNAHNIMLSYTSDSQYVTVTSTGYVTFYRDVSVTITVKTRDGSNISDKVYIRRPSNKDVTYDPGEFELP